MHYINKSFPVCKAFTNPNYVSSFNIGKIEFTLFKQDWYIIFN